MIELSKRDSFTLSIGIDWSKVAKLQAMEDIRQDQPELAREIDRLDYLYRQIKN